MSDGITYELTRIRLRDNWETTVYLVRHPLATTSVRVEWFPEPRRLDHWCAAHGHSEAIVAGFFLRDPYRPLGEVRVDGAAIEHEPIAPPRRAGRRSAGGSAAGRTAARVRRAFADRRGRSRGLLRRIGPVRLRHHRRPPPALCLGAVCDRALGGVLRRASFGSRRRTGPLASWRGCSSPSARRRRSTSTAGARPLSSTASTFSTAPTPTRTSPLPSRGPWSRRLSSRPDDLPHLQRGDPLVVE